MSQGKGSRPRNCFSKEFKNNYSEINWNPPPKKNEKCEKCGKLLETEDGYKNCLKCDPKHELEEKM